MSCKNTLFINGRPIHNIQSDLNSYVPDAFREIDNAYIQFKSDSSHKFDPPCWSYYADEPTSPPEPCDEVKHFLDKKYTILTPLNQLNVFIYSSGDNGIVNINKLKSDIENVLKEGSSPGGSNKIIAGTTDIVIYQLFFFIKLLHLANTYYGVNKRLCGITLPWKSIYDCSIDSAHHTNNPTLYKTIDYETMVALFQRCIVQKDSTLYFTYLFDIINSLFENAMINYIKKSKGLESNYDSLGYKNFYKYMKNEIIKNQIYKFKGNR